MRKTFVKVVSENLKNNPNSSLLLGDIGVFGFREESNLYPERVFNIGILEQTMVGLAAGMASNGMIPTIHTIAPFLVERAFEQIKIDFGYQKHPGNFVSVGASFDYAALGCTHHCPADVNLISNIPGFNIFVPGHAEEFAEMYSSQSQNGNLNYFRLSEVQNQKPYNVEYGQSLRLTDGADGLVIAVGPILEEVLKATSQLDVEVHYVNSFQWEKQINIDTEIRSKKVVFIEPYYSGKLLESTSRSLIGKGYSISQIGVPKSFIRKYGNYQEQIEYAGLNADSLKVKIERFLIE